MRGFRHFGTVLALLVVGGAPLVSGGARADELLVMPYSCRVVGGHPTLTPSEDQGHSVIGRREQQEFRACSPADPRLCRRWNVHRFDLDCGGVRVPWVEVAAAAGVGREGRAFLEDGHFELEMPARWSLEPDAPCARGGDFEGSGFRRFCDERMARVPRVTVTMPRGFAPMLGIDGIFVKDSAPRGAVADATTSSRRESIPEPIANPQRTKSSPQSEPAARAPEKGPAAPQVSPQPAPAAKASPPPSPEPAKIETSASGTTAAGAAPVIPQIINGANAPRPAQGAEAGVSETSALPDRSSSPPADDRSTVQSEVAGSSASAPDRVASTDGETAPPMPVSTQGGPLAIDATVITVGTLAALTLLTLALVLRRGRGSAVPALSRDISSVSLGKTAADGQRDRAGALTLVAEPPTGRDLDASPTLSSGPPVPLGDAMPRTRTEALQVLGMGIAPDVNEAAIKKIIDGLRLSWHPDHARDPADRAMRELRLKQINAAWDIIAGRRAS